MNLKRLVFTLSLALLFFATTLPVKAQRTNMSAREAVGLVSTQFGPQTVEWLAEMRAQGGIPQPSDWQILAYDERAPRLLYRFWAGGDRAGDGGVDDTRYPDDVPVGYFSANQIGVDSVAAFTIAEGEARKARMAFDSCDYLLRVREYSTERSGVFSCSTPRAVSSASFTSRRTTAKCCAPSGSTAINAQGRTGSRSSSTPLPLPAKRSIRVSRAPLIPAPTRVSASAGRASHRLLPRFPAA